MRDWLQPKIGNWLFRSYISRNGNDAAAGTLIGTLVWLRGFAERHGLDFDISVASSRADPPVRCSHWLSSLERYGGRPLQCILVAGHVGEHDYNAYEGEL